MRYRLGLPVLLLAAQASAEPAIAPVLPPQGPWKLDYADEECRLARTFGTGQETVTIQMTRASGLQEFGFVVAGASIPKLPAMTQVTLRLLEQGREEQFNALSGQVPDRSERFVRLYGASSNIIGQFSDSQVVGIKLGSQHSFSIKLPGERQAVAALDSCHVDLLKSWGLDVDKIKAVKVPPRPLGNPAYWATTNDYPVQALRAGKDGNVVFLLDVNSSGRPTRCSIARSSGVPQLDETTCQLAIRRARFDAAQNAEGQPIAGFYISRVRWGIPK